MKATRKIFFIIIVVSLLGLNVATLVSATAYNALYGLLSHLPIPSLLNNSIATKHQTLKHKNTKLIKENKEIKKDNKLLKNITRGFIANNQQKAKIIKTAIKRMRIRTAKIATSNFVSIPFESIPILGIDTIVAAAGTEIYLSCKNMKDLDKINNITNPSNADNQSDKVCGLQVPTVDEIKNKIGL